jgi:hypothetical protein
LNHLCSSASCAVNLFSGLVISFLIKSFASLDTSFHSSPSKSKPKPAGSVLTNRTGSTKSSQPAGTPSWRDPFQTPTTYEPSTTRNPSSCYHAGPTRSGSTRTPLTGREVPLLRTPRNALRHRAGDREPAPHRAPGGDGIRPEQRQRTLKVSPLFQLQLNPTISVQYQSVPSFRPKCPLFFRDLPL